MTETIYCAKKQAQQAPVLKLEKGNSEEHSFYGALFKWLEGCLRKEIIL